MKRRLFDNGYTVAYDEKTTDAGEQVYHVYAYHRSNPNRRFGVFTVKGEANFYYLKLCYEMSDEQRSKNKWRVTFFHEEIGVAKITNGQRDVWMLKTGRDYCDSYHDFINAQIQN